MNELHLKLETLETSLDTIRSTPMNNGRLDLIVCRPAVGERKVLDEGELDLEVGLVGDNWKSRGNSRTPDGSAHPDTQINIMNSRVIDLISGSKDRWSLAGDQLFIDLDLSRENLRAGSRLSIGSAILEVMAKPHNGCQKFMDRFGMDAMKFVNSPVGKSLRLRGINAIVIQPGKIRIGDLVTKIV